jgi:hypothetical protein
MKALIVVAAQIIFCAQFASAAGVENLKSILSEQLYTSGATEREQFSDSALVELCEQGFSKAYFGYGGAKARTINCSKGSIAYKSSSWDKASTTQSVVDDVKAGHKVLVHCWYGVDASVYVAAAAQTQISCWSGDQAADWYASLPHGVGKARVRELAERIRKYGEQYGCGN